MTESLTAWVPPSVLVVVSLALMSILWKKGDALLEKILARLEAIEKALHTFATMEQLGRLGDRMDGRITNVSERVAVLEALSKK